MFYSNMFYFCGYFVSQNKILLLKYSKFTVLEFKYRLEMTRQNMSFWF